ncbi:putative exported transglycosylase protein [Burkholderia cenocepacia]|uniref:lytic transglycosylase domain-containing protein n=1 Tax=Burkholderia cenocepacia TaxID=95486 RepID=UPI001993643F|nr:transglycosylase SLT domain-containing protein [Burkholderia cenocepacia]CAB5082896.1 putative exported transglycosylase protein [Burkholderia cenocepacia]CAB5083579.1 putative exported transglycosylase protein [Burkholderia cenocepacia]CAB5087712.1 putative exported transglycosylase protein [Burkholderia cenocepacia]CAB5095710.1 putative exported transglycosylase protein [Burkholderia cenocepacia]CAB5105106.1 putative exported transglycosylase protein [Burkholderia cenocepacia]
MPMVPTQATQQDFGQVRPAYDSANATPDAFGAQIGAAAQRAGGAIEQGADVAARGAIAFQGLQNETLAKNADIQLAAKLTALQFDPKNGYQTHLGKDAVDGYQGFQDSVQQAYQDARSALPNPEAQRMFDGAALRRVQYSMSSGAQHAAQQNKIWQVGTSEARAQLEMNTAANYYNDDNRFNQAVATVKDEAVSMGELQGWSPEQVAAKQADYVSKAWTQRIMRYAQQDPVAAQGMYSQNIEQVQAAERPNLEHFLKANVQPVLARNIVQNVMAGNPVVDGDQLDALHAAVRQQESRGNTAAIGPYVPGQGTAKGDMQVMDATNLNPGFGVRPAADNSAAERTRVGHDYLNAMIARYGGDQTLALAAYNWGPGNVDRLVQSAQASGTPVNDAAIVAKMPSETQKYISSINAKVPPKVGAAPTSADPRAHLADWQQQVSTLATQLYPNDPQFRDAAVSNLFNETNKIVAGQEGLQKQARDTLVSAAIGSPDGSKPTTLTDLLSTPDMKQAWATLRPEQQIGVMDLIEHNAKASDPQLNDTALSTYYKLKGEAANDPMKFANEDLMSQAKVLPHHLLLELMNLQATTDGRQARDQNKAMNLEHAMTVARPMLMAAGVHIPNAKSSPDKAADYNAFTGRMSQALDQFYTTNKRGPNDKELRDMSNSLLVQGAQSNSAGFFPWSSDKTARAFQVDPSSFYVPVPPAEKPKVQAAFQQAFGRAPTDSEMQDFYTKYTIANSKGK